MKSNVPVVPERYAHSRNSIRGDTPASAAFLRATSSAGREMSVATTCTWGRSDATVTAMQPEPVPMSATRRGNAGASIGSSVSSSSTISSLSGRGINTSGVTSKSRFQNS